MDRTTDLETIRKYPRRFTWGKVVQIHDVGPYAIVESDNDKAERSFHVYVGGSDTHRSARSLDEALLTAIAHRAFENKNTAGQATWAMARIIGTVS